MCEIYVGIDVGKTQLDMAVWKHELHWQVANDLDGIDALTERLQELAPTPIVLEPPADWSGRRCWS